MRLRPLGDRVVVQRTEADSKTAGGIIIPDNAKEKPKQGRVIAVGSGKKDEGGFYIPVDVKVGDIVLFTSYAGDEVKVLGDELIVLKESEIICVLEDMPAKKKAA